ncbi:MAG: LemA family protein, partial [Paludibacteraceae bacterium]|nr:LemA family protein [Paludibacteraceae bacterium]
MKKSTLSTIITLAVIGIIIAWGVGRYNAFVTMQENVDNAWGQVENQYQRRLDLIPNLVQTV